MDITKIIGLAFCVVMLSCLLKSYRPEYSFQIVILAGLIFFGYIIGTVNEIFDYIRQLCETVGVDVLYIEILFKIIGISYICEFASCVCKDAGESAVAVKIDIAGKVLILSSSIPIFTQLISVITKMLP